MMSKSGVRDDLNAKLDELGRRAAHVKETLAPASWWANPLVKLGVGFVAGYALGSLGRRGGAKAMNHESILHAIVRAGLAAATAMLVRSALEPQVGEPQKS